LYVLVHEGHELGSIPRIETESQPKGSINVIPTNIHTRYGISFFQAVEKSLNIPPNTIGRFVPNSNNYPPHTDMNARVMAI
jgi:hypothetical protein